MVTIQLTTYLKERATTGGQWNAWNKAAAQLATAGITPDFAAYPGGDHNYLSGMACKNNSLIGCFSFDNKLARAFTSDFDRYTIGRLQMLNGVIDSSLDSFKGFLENPAG